MARARRFKPGRRGATGPWPHGTVGWAESLATYLLPTASSRGDACSFPQTGEGGTKAMFEKQQAWAREHVILNNVHHAAGAFGLAIVLQHYLAGGPFLPVAVGWVLLGFTVAMHFYQFTR